VTRRDETRRKSNALLRGGARGVAVCGASQETKGGGFVASVRHDVASAGIGHRWRWRIAAEPPEPWALEVP
jgi:hypothetical protein